MPYSLITPGPGFAALQQPQQPNPAAQAQAQAKIQAEQMQLQASLQAQRDYRLAALQSQRDAQLGDKESNQANLGSYNRFLQSAWDQQWQADRDQRLADQRSQEAEHHTDLQARLNATQLGQAEEMRLHRLQQARSSIMSNPDLAPEEQRALITQVESGLNPLENRQRQAQTLQTQIQSAAAYQQAQQSAQLFNQHQEWLGRGIQGQLQTVTDPETGMRQLFHVDSQGRIQTLDFSQTQQMHQARMDSMAVQNAQGIQSIQNTGQMAPLQREHMQLSNQQLGQAVQQANVMNPLQADALRSEIDNRRQQLLSARQTYQQRGMAFPLELEQQYAHLDQMAQTLDQGAQSFQPRQRHLELQNQQLESQLDPVRQELDDQYRRGQITQQQAQTRLANAHADLYAQNATTRGTLTPQQDSRLVAGFERTTRQDISAAAATLRSPGVGRPAPAPDVSNNWGMPRWAGNAVSVQRAIATQRDTNPQEAERLRLLLPEALEQDRQREVARQRVEHYRRLEDTGMGSRAPVPQAPNPNIQGNIGRDTVQPGQMPTAFGMVGAPQQPLGAGQGVQPQGGGQPAGPAGQAVPANPEARGVDDLRNVLGLQPGGPVRPPQNEVEARVAPLRQVRDALSEEASSIGFQAPLALGQMRRILERAISEGRQLTTAERAAYDHFLGELPRGLILPSFRQAVENPQRFALRD